MSAMIDEIITYEPYAKPLMQSLSARGIMLLAVGWAAQNIVAWLALDQSMVATITAGLLGLVSFIGALVGVMRRADIRVPDWLVDVLENMTSEAPK